MTIDENDVLQYLPAKKVHNKDFYMIHDSGCGCCSQNHMIERDEYIVLLQKLIKYIQGVYDKVKADE